MVMWPRTPDSVFFDVLSGESFYWAGGNGYAGSNAGAVLPAVRPRSRLLDSLVSPSAVAAPTSGA